MLSTLEMLFKCLTCRTVRQYGTAINLNDQPKEKHPFLRCTRCRTATLHTFSHVEPRTNNRETKVFSEMRMS